MPFFLIVDDSPWKMQFLRSMIERAKWQGDILEAWTTEEAKKLIDTHPEISAAFVDYYVPSECGPSVIRYLRAKNPNAKIALVSSADSKRNASEAISSGANAVLCTSDQSDVVEKSLMDLLADWTSYTAR